MKCQNCKSISICDVKIDGIKKEKSLENINLGDHFFRTIFFVSIFEPLKSYPIFNELTFDRIKKNLEESKMSDRERI